MLFQTHIRIHNGYFEWDEWATILLSYTSILQIKKVFYTFIFTSELDEIFL